MSVMTYVCTNERLALLVSKFAVPVSSQVIVLHLSVQRTYILTRMEACRCGVRAGLRLPQDIFELIQVMLAPGHLLVHLDDVPLKWA